MVACAFRFAWPTAACLRAALALACFLAATAGARADFVDEFFGRLKQLSAVGVNPDAVEMARYSVRYPDNAAEIYDHAAKEDYPYFALIGAVKAIKNKNVKGVGTFTLARCMTPITVIDQVFGKSSQYIDDASGKAETDGIVDQATQYGVEYAQQQNANAKQEVIDQLSENVPYFKDIPVICHFAFNTQFVAEKNIQQILSDTSRDFRDAYYAFKSGDVVEGVEKLSSAGLSGDTACTLVDQMIGGGAIGNTPVVGDLAKGACKSFAGTVIKGIQSGASALGDLAKGAVGLGAELAGDIGGAAQDGGCFVVNLFSNICDDDDKDRPPIDLQRAAANRFCKKFGGLRQIVKHKKTGGFSLTCRDETSCEVKPGKPPACTAGADIVAAATAAIEAQLTAWSKDFLSRWRGQCEQIDDCDRSILALNKNALAEARAALKPMDGWPPVEKRLQTYEKRAASTVAESKARFADTNREITEGASEGMAQIAVAKWSKECWDDLCRQQVKTLGKKMAAAAVQLQSDHPDWSSLQVQKTINPEYGRAFQNLITQSNQRKTLADRNAPAEKKLPILGCKLLGGRAGQWLCTGNTAEAGFTTCRAFILKRDGATGLCIAASGRRYGTPAAVISTLANAGCKRAGSRGLAFSCAAPKAKEACLGFANGGMEIDCTGQKIGKSTGREPPPADETTPSQGNRGGTAPASRLQALGCKSLGGRSGEWLCASDRGFNACVGFVKSADAQMCVSTASKARYGTGEKLATMMRDQGCTRQRSTRLAFICSSPQALGICRQFQDGGMAVGCSSGEDPSPSSKYRRPKRS